MLISAGVAILCGIVYLHWATYYYTSTLVVVATQNENQSLASRFGDLTALGGITLPTSQSVSPFALYPEALQSRAVADDIVRSRPDILHSVFWSQWDPVAKAWRTPSAISRNLVNFVKGILGSPVVPWTPPGGAELRDIISQNVNVDVDTKKPIITITFRDPNRDFTKQFLEVVNESTDRVLRRMALDRSSQYARYIQGELMTVQDSELRQALRTSLSQQETLIVMSNSKTAFAAQPLGETISSLRPTTPKPIQVLSLAAVIGVVAGFAFGGLNHQIGDVFLTAARRRRHRVSN